jgi:hypothetical protein
MTPKALRPISDNAKIEIFKNTKLFSKIKTHLTGMHPTSAHLLGGCLMGVYPTGASLIGVSLIGVSLYLTGVCVMRGPSRRLDP